MSAEVLMQLLGGDKVVEGLAQIAAAGGADAAEEPIPIEVDVSLVLAESPDLGFAIMQDAAGALACGLRALVQQRLDSSGVDVQLPRLLLRTTNLPLPLMAPSEAAQMALSHRAPLLVTFAGVVIGVTSAGARVVTRHLTCPFCTAECDVPDGARSMPCCGGDMASAQEDVSQRVVSRVQQLWVSDLRADAGCCARGVSREPLVVFAADDLAGRCSLGQAVEVTGFASQRGAPAAGGAAGGLVPHAGACVEVEAIGITAAAPHLSWRLPPGEASDFKAASAVAGGPLAALVAMLNAALAFESDPHVAISLLASAAACASGAAAAAAAAAAGSVDAAAGGGKSQINVMVLQEEAAPQVLRLLRGAAELLSPQALSLPLGQAEQVLPTVVPGRDGAYSAFCGALGTANGGVAVVDAEALPAKAKRQLAEALQRTSLAAPGAPGLVVPQTATVWAACGLPDLIPADPSMVGAGASKRWAKPTVGCGGYDVVLSDASDESQLLWGGGAGGVAARMDPCRAAALLRHVMARAAASPPPALGPGAHEFLSMYARVLRQSAQLPLPQSEVLGSLARLARAAAALRGAPEAQAAPDAVLAVLLVDQTLTSKMGGSYQSALELPPGACDLASTGGRSLDQQLAAMAGFAATLFRQFAEGPGAGAGGGCGSGDDESIEDGGGASSGGRGGDDARRRRGARREGDAAAAAGGWGLALSGDDSDGSQGGGR